MQIMTKKEIRKESKERRKALGETQEIEKSEQIRKWVASLPEYQAAKTVYCYVDYNHEARIFRDPGAKSGASHC